MKQEMKKKIRCLILVLSLCIIWTQTGYAEDIFTGGTEIFNSQNNKIEEEGEIFSDSTTDLGFTNDIYFSSENALIEDNVSENTEKQMESEEVLFQQTTENDIVAIEISTESEVIYLGEVEEGYVWDYLISSLEWDITLFDGTIRACMGLEDGDIDRYNIEIYIDEREWSLIETDYFETVGTHEILIKASENVYATYTYEVYDGLPVIASGNCGNASTWTIDVAGVLRINGSGEIECEWEEYSGDIEKIIIADGITEIGEYAFYDCYNCCEIIIPESVTKINKYAFADCDDLEVINIPKKVTDIGAFAFQSCQSLKSIIIPENVISIGMNAFELCTNLRDIYYEGTIDTWVNINFEALESNPMYYAENLYINGEIINGNINISNNIVNIGNYVFYNWTNIVSITLPENIKRIGDYAFTGCVNLKFIMIPEDVTQIGKYAFSGCTSLESIIIPENVTQIGEYAFSECVNLTFVDLPDNVTTIKEGAFSGCSRITSINIPKKITYIEEALFKNCESIRSILLPNGVKGIGYGAFEGCKNLISVSFPDGMEKIFDNAFISCESLTSVLLPNSITDIKFGAFAGCTKLSSVTLSSGLTCIEPSVFSGCSSLSSIIIPEGVTDISGWAFKDCINLKSVTLPSSLKNLGFCAFNSCNSLTEIVIPEGVRSIEAYVFCATSLKEIVIPETVEEIGSNAFAAIPTLEKVIVYAKECTLFLDLELFSFDNPNVVLYGYSGSTIEVFAKKNNYIFSSLDASTIEHIKVIDKAVKATCTQNGLTEGSHCSVCGEVFVAQEEVKASGHKWGKWVIIKESTTTATGLSKRTCILCSEIEQKVIDKKVVTSLVKPQSFSVKAVSGKKIKINWSKVANADGYRVYRKIKGGDWSRITTIKSPSTISYTDDTPVAGVKYYYKVRAYYKSVPETIWSPYTDSKSTIAKTAAPVLKSVTSTSYNKITIKWDTVANATGYRIYRKTEDGSWKKLKTVAPSIKSYTDSTVVTGIPYSYTVRASYTSYGEKLWGEYNKSGLTAKTKLSKTSVTLLKSYSSHKNKLKWSAVEGATGYQIYVKIGKNGTYKKLKTTNMLSYTHIKLKKGTKYYYKVRAYRTLSSDARVYSSYSDAKSVICK